MNKTVVFSLQKGGIAKSTSSGVTSFLLSKKGYKVLHVDMDSQANSTQMITEVDDATETFGEKDILEAIKEQDPRTYIIRVSEGLDILPATDYLAMLDQFVFNEYTRKHKQKPGLALYNTLEKIKEFYDYIIIDTPPSLSILTLNALFASDYVVIPTNTEKFSYNALERFLGTVEEVNQQKKNLIGKDIKVAGILRSLHDKRRTDNKIFSEMMEESYSHLLFNTVIHRKAATGRLPIFGLYDNSELKVAINEHEKFVEELLNNV
ncbi:ParA family protein [Alkalibacillus haloalkaliphilus]|uniref:ParA family protein n=1 Tax=Alkalibacillus haloalkaliphilus TaxID=94136 RepID=UPI002935BBE8|nr:ParA family protein [Alkalibacillus haloalkaliphilus]MDV2583485.1 ParA family protein [Alkalibacillus haloalkaliphilus]